MRTSTLHISVYWGESECMEDVCDNLPACYVSQLDLETPSFLRRPDVILKAVALDQW